MDEIIIGYVEKNHNEYFKNHSKYKEYLKKMERIDLLRFNEQDVEIILKPFLYKWGRMGLVLGGKEYKGWETDIVEPIRSNSNKLNEWRAINFESSNLPDFKNDIIKFYDSLKTIIDRVAATKTMHIICPKFFPLWDNDIARIVKAEALNILVKADKYNNFFGKIDDFSGKDYYRFMLLLQAFFEKYENTFLKLAKTYEKSIVKILDDFLWMIAHRPLSIFL